MPKINLTNIKTKAKAVGKATGIVALSTAVGFGAYKIGDKIERKKVFNNLEKIERVTVKARIKGEENPLNELNKKAKITEIYFYEKETIRKINIDVARFEQITRLMPDSVRVNINRIINNKIKLATLEINKNPKLKKTIEQRVGVSDYRTYLLSLPMDKLIKTFTPKELELIRLELNKIPQEKLIEIKKELNKVKENTISLGAFISIFLSAGLFEFLKKKKELDVDFH